MPRRKKVKSTKPFGAFDAAAPAMLARVAGGESFASVANAMAAALSTTPNALGQALRRRRARKDAMPDERRNSPFVGRAESAP